MAGKKVLVVEDEAIIQHLCRRILGGPGREVEIVSCVQDAFAVIRRGGLDLLITDLRLPDGDGIDVIQALRAKMPGCKIIIITGSPTPEERFDRIRHMEETEYISKPFEVEVLLSAVRKALGD